MMKELKFELMIILLLSFSLIEILSAQSELEKSVIGNGGEKIRNQLKDIQLTIGQSSGLKKIILG